MINPAALMMLIMNLTDIDKTVKEEKVQKWMDVAEKNDEGKIDFNKWILTVGTLVDTYYTNTSTSYCYETRPKYYYEPRTTYTSYSYDPCSSYSYSTYYC